MILYPKALQDMGYDMISQNMGYLPILQITQVFSPPETVKNQK